MTRTTGGFVTKRNHKKIINFNKGYKGAHSKLFKVANQENMRSLRYSYGDRRKKKGDFKKIWIKQINNEAKKNFLNYSKTINNLKLAKILINKKILANLAIYDKNSFNKITKK